MPSPPQTPPRTYCEQCLRETTTAGDCERHPFSRQLSMDRPDDREHYQVMLKLRRSRLLPWLGVGGYLSAVALIAVMHFSSMQEPSVVESLIAANMLLILITVLVSPLFAALWFFGVLSQDLMTAVRRRIWGIEEEILPDILTCPVDDPDPIHSAEEARQVREIHRWARSRSNGPGFIR